MHQRRVPHAGFCGGRTQHHPLSAASAETRVGNAYVVHTQRPVVKVNVRRSVLGYVVYPCHLEQAF